MNDIKKKIQNQNRIRLPVPLISNFTQKALKLTSEDHSHRVKKNFKAMSL